MESILSWFDLQKDNRENEVAEISQGEVEYFNIPKRIYIGSGEDFSMELQNEHA